MATSKNSECSKSHYRNVLLRSPHLPTMRPTVWKLVSTHLTSTTYLNFPNGVSQNPDLLIPRQMLRKQQLILGQISRYEFYEKHSFAKCLRSSPYYTVPYCITVSWSPLESFLVDLLLMYA